jgi:hypothetical protein
MLAMWMTAPNWRPAALVLAIFVAGLASISGLAVPVSAQEVTATYLDHRPVNGNGITNMPWREASADERAVLTAPAPFDGKWDVDAKTAVAVTSLPFYGDVQLARVKSESWSEPALFIYFLMDPERNLYRLDGLSNPIHDANAAYPLIINEHTVLKYAWFFCFFVRGEEGPFLPVESVDDEFAPGGNAKFREALEEHASPLRLTAAHDDGSFSLDGTIAYSNAIFSAKLKVMRSGMVEMLDDVAVAADLPVKVHAPLK